MKRLVALAFVVVIAGIGLALRGSPAGSSGAGPVASPVVGGPARTAPALLATPAPGPAPASLPVGSRAAGEWQGMLGDPDDERPLCDVSSRCGLATGCVAGRCSGCTADAECASGEACVLDHCVRAELVACRGRADCGDGELCVLSGISAGARGNADMRAYCQGDAVDLAQSRDAHDDNLRARAGVPAPPRPVTPRGLLETL